MVRRCLGIVHGFYRQREIFAGGISLGDIQNLPTFWVLALFGTFYNFRFCVQTCRHLGGGMCILFEMCKKTPFQKCMGLGGRA